MSSANVFSSNLSNVVWNTDKAEIVNASATDSVIYSIYVVQAGNPIVGIVGDVTVASNVMISPNASENLVGATFVTGPGVANTTTVVSAVNGQSLTMSANASASFAQSQYTLTTGNPGSMYGGTTAGNVLIAPASRQQIYVGAGNRLTVWVSGGPDSTTANCTIKEIGTASSATAGN